MANKKMGRPTSKKKDYVLKVRVNKTDLEILDSLSKLYHLNRSTLVRNIIWYFIDNNVEDILKGEINLEHQIPIDEIRYNGVDMLYDIIGNDDDYLEFKKEMSKRQF